MTSRASVVPKPLSIELDDMSFGALSWGADDAPLALLVHGYPDTAHTWRELGPFLAERGWRAVAPFTRGYAPTDLAPDDRYFVLDQASDIIRLHKALDGDSRAVLIGHDWGAAALWEVTATDPARFSRYVALSVPPLRVLLRSFTGAGTVRLGLRQARMSWYVFYNLIPGAERGLERVIPKLWRDWSPGFEANGDLRHVWGALDTPARRRAALRYYRCNMLRGITSTLTMDAGAPVLYLHGEDDGCMQAGLIERFPDALTPGSRFERVAGAGHFLHLEQPDVVNELIAEWLD